MKKIISKFSRLFGNRRNKYKGSSFDEFLKEEDLLEKVDAVAIKRIIAYQLEDTMKKTSSQ